MKKRLLSILLAAAMLLTLLPVAALAEGGEADAAAGVQALIDALPGVGEIAAMTEGEKAAVADALDDIDTAMEPLDEAQKAELDLSAYHAALMALQGGGFTEDEWALVQAAPETLTLVKQLARQQLLSAYEEASGMSPLKLGGSDNPFRIAKASQLAELAELVNAGDTNFKSAYYELTADIDLSEVCGADLNGGTNWTPIGTNARPFSGTFDGQGHTVSNLYINNASANYQGLFGYVYNSVIQNVGVVNAYVRVRDYCGGVVGYVAKSTIQNCYAANATLSSSATYGLGGIVGGIDMKNNIYENNYIRNCYSSGTISSTRTSGGAAVGGIVGRVNNPTTITSCYSTAAVSATKCPSAYVGGVVGQIISSTVGIQYCAALCESISAGSNSNAGAMIGKPGAFSRAPVGCYYWDGMTVTVGGETATQDQTGVTALSYDAETGLSAQFSAIFKNTAAWAFADNKLPVLNNMLGTQRSDLPGYMTLPASAIKISSADELLAFALKVNSGVTYKNKTVVLTKDIDLSTVCGADLNGGTSWTPIGTNARPFSGTFDGQGHTVSNLYINAQDAICQGLFGFADIGTIQNIGVVGADVTASDYVGGVAGYLNEDCIIQNCYATGSVIATSANTAAVGGLVGWLAYGSVINCYTSGTVQCEKDKSIVGGIVGGANAAIQNCYSTATVLGGGTSNTGGILGKALHAASVQNCAALNKSVSVTSGNYVGAVIGNLGGTASDNAYWAGMTVTVGGKAVDQKDTNGSFGLTGTNGVLNKQFSEIFEESDAWVYTENGLPVLNNMLGKQSSALPGYMTVPEGADLAISNAAELLAFASSVNGGNDYAGKTVVLTENIDLSTVCGADKGSWTPIGAATPNFFSGTFDGAGYTVSGLYINDDTNNYVGLFGYVIRGKVKNLGVVDASITSTKGYAVGAVAGSVAGGNSLIENCYSTGTVASADQNSYVGGLVGGTEDVKRCYSTCSVEGTGRGAYVGGLAGYLFQSSALDWCYATGPVKGGAAASAGGLVGYIMGSTIRGSYAAGPVTGGTSAYVGGLAGKINGTSKLSACLALNANAAAGSGSSAGALFGLNSNGTISGCAYWGGMTVSVGDAEQTVKDATGSAVLWLKDGVLYSVSGSLDWSAYQMTNLNGWTLPDYTLGLPRLTGTPDWPAMALASMQTLVLTIDYTKEMLTVPDESLTYTIQAGGSQAVYTPAGGGIAIDKAWFGQILTITKGGKSQTLAIPNRPAVVSPTISDRTSSTIDVAAVARQEYAIKTEAGAYGTWNTTGTFSNLTPGTAYTVATRIKAVANFAFGSDVVEVGVTTPMEVSGLTYKEDSGVFTVIISANTPTAAAVAIAVYDGNGKMLGIYLAEKTVSGNAEYEVPAGAVGDQASTIRVLVLTADGGWMPLGAQAFTSW